MGYKMNGFSGFKMKSSPAKLLDFTWGGAKVDKSKIKVKSKKTGNKRFSLFGSIFGRGRA